MAAYNSHHTHESAHAKHNQPSRHAKAAHGAATTKQTQTAAAAAAALAQGEQADEESIKPDDFNRKLRLRTQPAAKPSSTNAEASTSMATPASAPKKRGRPRKSEQTTPARAQLNRTNSTPSRTSLRQAMAASVRETSATPSLSSEVQTEDPLAKHRNSVQHDLEVSDLELDGSASSSSGDEFDSELEEEEESAIRRDFDTGSTADDLTDDDDDALMAYASDADEDIDNAIPTARHRRTRDNTPALVSDGSDLEGIAFNFDADILPPSGGLGVVTWSDYDSIDASDSDDEGEIGTAQDDEATFEESLEELLAISEAVVGHQRTSRHHNDLEEMWFEDASSGASDQDSYSSRDHGDRTILVVDNWDDSDEHADSFDVEWEFNESDRGNTTDSLDSDDHAGLRRFGIEADSDDNTDLEIDGKDSAHNGTTSLADVQAPTTADLALLPQFQIIKQAKETPRRIKFTSSSLTPKPTSRKSKSSKETKKTPAMGTFENRTRSRAVVISENGSVAPSPFVRRHRGRDYAIHTSRRTRSDSKVSTTSTGMSFTDGSVLGDDMSPPLEDSFRFDLDDVLHASILDMNAGNGGTTSTSEDSETDNPSTALSSDLSRWNRVPIGAFRSSTMIAFNPSTHVLSAESAGSRKGKGNRVFVPFSSSSALRKYGLDPASAAAGRSGGRAATLSSPHARKLSRRALEKRMLTSPVMGPSSSMHTLSTLPLSLSSSSSPKSNKTRRKEKKMMAMRASPKKSLVVGDKPAQT